MYIISCVYGKNVKNMLVPQKNKLPFATLQPVTCI